MGDEQRLSADELIAQARAQFESATDFTVAVEEEFAILDPESLDLTNRFEDVQAAARGTALEEHLVGELIASEVEVRTGKQETLRGRSSRHGGAPRAASGRSSSRWGSSSARRARIRGPTGRSSASSTRRTTGGTTSSCATSSGATTRSACTSTSGSTGPTARSRSSPDCGTSSPSCSRCRRARRSSRT